MVPINGINLNGHQETEPKVNLSCLLVKAQVIECRDMPIPTIGDEDVLVEVVATGLCGSDVRSLYGHLMMSKCLTSPNLVAYLGTWRFVKLLADTCLGLTSDWAGAGPMKLTEPLTLGHESCGRVAKIGAKVKSVAVGDRVAIEPNQPCGKCRVCRIGASELCKNGLNCGLPVRQTIGYLDRTDASY